MTPAAIAVRSHFPIAAAVACAIAASFQPAALWAVTGHPGHAPGVVELDTRSEYSHIRVKRQGAVRTLCFVRPGGEEAEETMVNLKKPHELLLPYSRFMFASYLLRPQQQRVLILGLGGGAMVHFLRHYDPKLAVDVVEIDPVVVDIAARYFDIRPRSNINVITGDGFQFLEKTEEHYDVIYLDAYLKPAADTDVTGLPLRLKTERFYKDIQRKLSVEGLVAINLNLNKGTETDLQIIRSCFPVVYVFRSPKGNVIAFGSTARSPLSAAQLHTRARELDQRFKASFSFVDTLGWMAR